METAILPYKTSIFLFVLLFTTSLFSFSQSNNVIIYVSHQGEEDNSGTQDSPISSLKSALPKIALLKQNPLLDTIFVNIEEGSYYMDEPLMITPEHSGSKRSPIIFMGNSNKEKSVFYGGIKLPLFEKIDNGLWRTKVPNVPLGYRFEQLYINGQRRFRAQTPSRGDFFSVKAVQQIPLDTNATDRGRPEWTALRVSITDENAKCLQDIKPEEYDQIVCSFYHKWDVTKLRLRHIDFSTNSLFFTQKGMQPWNTMDSKTHFILENNKNGLKYPGAWYMDKNRYIYYHPLPGETPESVEAMSPLTDKFIVIAGDSISGKLVEHLEFRNLSFRVSGYHTPPEGNLPIQAAADINAAIMVDFSNAITFRQCEIANTGLGAIWFRRGCTNSQLRECHLYDLGACGIKIGEPAVEPSIANPTHHIVVDNNIIQHGGFVFPAAVGVLIFHSGDNEITHNDIADFKYTGISVGWIWGYEPSIAKRNKIDFNHIHHLGWGELSDMGGIYTLGLSEGTTVNNNHIHHIYSRYYGGWGLYPDEGTTGITMENNLVYACKSSAFHQHYGRDNVIKNNIFASQIRAQLEATRLEKHNSFTFVHNIIYYDKGILADLNWHTVQFVSDYNCYWNTHTQQIEIKKIPFKLWQTKGKDKHSIIANPEFVSPETFDFRFKNNKTIKKIGFKPFDYSKAGVYGSDEWKNKAKLSTSLLEAFDKMVVSNEEKKISQW